MGDSSCAGERQGVPLQELAREQGLRPRAAMWGPAQERSVRPRALCSPLTVPTSALEAVSTSGTMCSVYRDPVAQAAAVPQASWYRMGTACPSPPATVASPVPMLHGNWLEPKWCRWIATTAPASMGLWHAHTLSAHSWDLGQPGAGAQLCVVGASQNATGAARDILGQHHAMPRTWSNSKSVTCSPVLSALLGKCSAPVPPPAQGSAHTCTLTLSVCGNSASLAVAALKGSCCTMALVCPLMPAPAPSAPCPGGSA